MTTLLKKSNALIKKVLIGLLVVNLTACASNIPQKEIVNTKPPLYLEVPNNPDISLYNYTIITDKNSGQKFLELKEKGKKPVLFAITVDEYKNLTIDQQEYQNYIAQLLLIIEKYKLYYE